MHRFLICCAIFLTACTPPVETVLMVPHVPADLREPCTAETRAYQTLQDAALIITDLVEIGECANKKITGTDDILTRAEALADGVLDIPGEDPAGPS